MTGLEKNDMWDLVPFPPKKKATGCHWVYIVKLNPDGSLTRLKARLVAKGHSDIWY